MPNKSDKQSEINRQLQQSVKEQQKVSRMVIQKDLELAKINDQLDRQVNQLRALHEIINKIRLINNQKKALDIIARGLVLDLNFSATIILLGSPPFRLVVKYGYKKIDTDKLRRHFLVQKTYQKKTPDIIYNINKTQTNQKQLGNILHFTSFCVLPLQVRKKHYGLFICGLDDPYQKLNKLDIEFLEIVSDSIAITLENLETEERQRAVDKLKSEFVSIASHQLRTPLSIIKWTLKMCLNGDLGSLNEEQKNFLKKTYTSNERMIDLVNDLLDASRVEEGRLEYKFTKFNIIQLLQDILVQHEIPLKNKQLKLKTNLKNKLKIIIKGDKEKLFLAFNNLIDNAIKFTPKEKIISVLIKKNKNNIQIIIKDQGIGMDQKDQEQLFTKFFRAERAKRMQTQGSGLGLFIAKSIIKKHQGQIKIDSVLGKGTVVTCYLPN